MESQDEAEEGNGSSDPVHGRFSRVERIFDVGCMCLVIAVAMLATLYFLYQGHFNSH